MKKQIEPKHKVAFILLMVTWFIFLFTVATAGYLHITKAFG